MKHPVSTVIRQFLIDNGVVCSPEAPVANVWPCFLSSMPDGPTVPNKAVAIYDTQGVRDGRILRPYGTVLERPGCQIKVRTDVYPAGWALMDQIRYFLDTANQSTTSVGNSLYQIMAVNRPHPPLDMGLEPGQTKRRHNISLNLTAVIWEIGLDDADLAFVNQFTGFINTTCPADFPS